MKDGFWDYFKATGDGGTFEMKPHWEKIHPDLSDIAKEKLIEGVTLYSVEGANSGPKEGKITPIDGALKIELRGIRGLSRPNKAQKYGAFFISIKFNGDVLNGLHGFKDYDFTSPWNIQVGIYQKSWFGKKEVDLKKSGSDVSG